MMNKRISALIALALFFLSNHSMAAAPLCARVFTQSAKLSLKKVELTPILESLARLKMEADLADVRGEDPDSPDMIPMATLFENKLTELIQRLDGKETRESILEKIKSEISKIQDGKEPVEKIVEKEVRQKEDELVQKIKPPVYERTEKMPFDWFVGTIDYSPKNNLLVLGHRQGEGVVKTIRFDSQEEVEFGRDMYIPTVMQDGNQLISYSKKGAIRIHDLKTGKEISSKPAPIIVNDYYVGAFSPGFKHFVLSNHTDSFWVMDTATGKQIGAFYSPDKLGKIGNILRVKFISDDQALIAINKTMYVTTWVLYDIPSRTYKTLEASSYSDVTASADGQSLFAIGEKTIEFNRSDLSVVSETEHKSLSARNGTIVEAIPNSFYHIIASREDTSQPFAYIANITQDILYPESNLAGYYYKPARAMPVNLPSRVIFSEDGHEMVIISIRQLNNGSNQYQVDKWEKK